MIRPYRLAVSNTLGTFLEYFDYTLYGFSAPLIAHLFFPTQDRVSSLLLAWSVFFISFLVRPFGAFLFGHWGDRIGRRKVLSACILLMAIPTCLIGLLPTYQQAGLFAPITLMLCRIAQGFAVSGEFAGCSVYLYEVGVKYKGFLASLTTCASGFGMLAASLWILFFTHYQLAEHFVAGSYWRIPFIVAGILIGIIGFYLRRLMPETLPFAEINAKKEILKQPFLQIVKQEPGKLVMSAIISAYTTFITYTLLVYMATYLTEELHYPIETALLITSLVGLIESVAATFFSYLSDLFGRFTIMCLGTIGMLALAVPLFNYLQTGSLFVVVGCLTILALCLASFDGPMIAYILDQFNVGKRYSALGVSYNLGVGIIGGSAPLLLSWLIAKTHNSLMPGYFLAGLAIVVLTTLGIYSAKVKNA